MAEKKLMSSIRQEMMELHAPYPTVGAFMASPSFEPWYRYHFSRCARLAQRQVRCDPATAQDLAQECFLYLFEHHQATCLEEQWDLSSLLRTHLQYALKNYLHARRHPVRGAVSLDAPLPERKNAVPYHTVMPVAGPSVEELAIIHDQYQRVMAYVGNLPQLYRDILLHVAVGFSRREMVVYLQARYPGLTHQHLKNAFDQARLRVRTHRQSRVLVDQQHFVCSGCGRGAHEGVAHQAKGYCKRCYEREVLYPQTIRKRTR